MASPIFRSSEDRVTRQPRLVLLAVLGLVFAISGAGALAGQGAPQVVNDTGLRVIVSVRARHLWVVRDADDTLLSAPVAVGSGRTLSAGGRTWTFRTPRGVRLVLAKETDPVWIRPDWSYIEAARANHLRLEALSPTRPRRLSGGRLLVVRDNLVGVMRDSLALEVLPLEDEIVFGGVLYMPPIGTDNRAVPSMLGAYRLNLGDGIGLHGTPYTESIGRAVTHGCLRLGDADLEWVFTNVPVGTRVYIY